MTELEAPFRTAVESDARELAELVNYAGEGLPLHVWRKLASGHQDPWDVGRSRQAEKARAGQVWVADSGGRAIAGLTGYAIGSQPAPIDDDIPALFRPLQELENEAPDSWYVNVLACYPEHRGKGLGSGLLDLAEQIALDAGLSRMSVIVAGTNTGARRLYERKGYRQTATRACVRGDWITDTEDWVLLIKHMPGCVPGRR